MDIFAAGGRPGPLDRMVVLVISMPSDLNTAARRDHLAGFRNCPQIHHARGRASPHYVVTGTRESGYAHLHAVADARTTGATACAAIQINRYVFQSRTAAEVAGAGRLRLGWRAAADGAVTDGLRLSRSAAATNAGL